MGLGIMSVSAFLITLITGVMLMFYYKPYTDVAYLSMLSADAVPAILANGDRLGPEERERASADHSRATAARGPVGAPVRRVRGGRGLIRARRPTRPRDHFK